MLQKENLEYAVPGRGSWLFNSTRDISNMQVERG